MSLDKGFTEEQMEKLTAVIDKMMQDKIIEIKLTFNELSKLSFFLNQLSPKVKNEDLRAVLSGIDKKLDIAVQEKIAVTLQEKVGEYIAFQQQQTASRSDSGATDGGEPGDEHVSDDAAGQ